MSGRALVVGLVVVAVAGGGGHRSAPPSSKDVRARAGQPIVTPSADSDAPASAPAHWLPPEAWVYNHWLPYDEARLYAALHTDRAGVWRQLRGEPHQLGHVGG